ncbi:MAG: galactitol-1-phosphate 5-dehydrogenase [Bacillota bacterium]
MDKSKKNGEIFMKAAAIYSPNDIRIVEIPEPRPSPGEVIVRIRACGICGSDLPRVFGDGAHFYPVVLGHEAAGEVVEIGAEVSGFKEGDRVAIAPLVPCMKCDNCLRGRYSLCKQYSFIGSRRQGCMAEYVSVPAMCLLKIPEGLSFEEAAMVEPATIPLHGLLKCRTIGGLRVAVLGTGTIGLLAVQWAKFLGASEVVAVDINERKLQIARVLGADIAVNPADVGAQTLAQAIASITGQEGCDLVVETAGIPATQVQAVEIAATGGMVLYIGTAHGEVRFPPAIFEEIIRKELTLLGSWMSYSPPFPGREWALAVRALSDGRLKTGGMITHKYDLSRARDALETLRSCAEAVKVILVG